MTIEITFYQKTKVEEMAKKKNYRPNVAAIILSSKYPEKVEFFIARRNDFKDAWQFPQGGIDEGEDVQTALFRELEEEIGTNEVDIIAEFPDWISYDFPAGIASKMYPYDGQEQRYFLVKLRDESKINLATKHPEFDEYKFVPFKKIFKYITFFKRPIYKEVIDYFNKKGFF